MKSSVDTTCENLFQCCSFVQIVLVFSLFRLVRQRNVIAFVVRQFGLLVSVCDFASDLQFRISVQHLGRDDSYVVLIFNFINNILRVIARRLFYFSIYPVDRLIKFPKSDS